MQNPHKQLILASASPRRKLLLEQAGIIFDVVPSDADETINRAMHPTEHACFLAKKKATAVAHQHPDAYIVGADTIVVIDRLILGKPRTRGHAKSMLQKLNGSTHEVITGYAIQCKRKKKCETKAVSTLVRFKTLTDKEIEWYLDTGEPFDKAGSYAIQGQGAFMVEYIRGSYTNVVGLPMSEMINSLIRFGLADHMRENY